MPAAYGDLPRALIDYFDRSGIALSLSPVGQDVPLTLVNPAFCALTGYDRAEVEGRNCRFLQGEDTRAEDRRAMHDFIADDSRDDGRFPVLNFRKDGTPFYNFVFMSRLRDMKGECRFILASQFDMTAATRQTRVIENDAELQRRLNDIETISKEFGLAMVGSAQLLSDSIAMIARMSFDDTLPGS